MVGNLDKPWTDDARIANKFLVNKTFMLGHCVLTPYVLMWTLVDIHLVILLNKNSISENTPVSVLLFPSQTIRKKNNSIELYCVCVWVGGGGGGGGGREHPPSLLTSSLKAV